MTALFALSLAASCGASTAAGIRWLRVAQREHYLPGAVIRFAGRWWRVDPWNELGALFACVAFGCSFLFAPIALGTALVIGAGPRGLGLRGRTAKLAWTPRLRRCALASGVLAGVACALGGAFGGLRGATIAAAAVALGIPFVVDASLVALAPLERALGRRYVKAASKRLARVAPVIVAITGSYGKTSTKGYVAHLLSRRWRVLASPQSFNNQAGLARTVNENLAEGTEVLVAEMGTYGPGEIAAMCRWLPPSIAVITAIGPVHLERFKSLERTLAAKAEITVSATTVVLNTDDERLERLAGELVSKGKTVVACSATDRLASVAVLAHDGELEILIGGVSIGTVVLDPTRALAPTNLACAIGVARALECEPKEIIDALRSLPVAAHRLERREGASGAVIFDDTYNSNPAGVRFALDALRASGENATRRIVVTPGMVELGSHQYAENAAFGALARGVATELVVVGRTNRRALLSGFAGGAKEDPSAAPATVTTVRDRNDAVVHVTRAVGPGDVVLYENDLPDHYP